MRRPPIFSARRNCGKQAWGSQYGKCGAPIPQVLAEAFRDVADLVMMESYVGDITQYWWIACQVWSARRFGILSKTIVVLGVGKGGNSGERLGRIWEELERQVRFVRLIAPESPGVGFYGGSSELLTRADAHARGSLTFRPMVGGCPKTHWPSPGLSPTGMTGRPW